jgi:DNA transformation protein
MDPEAIQDLFQDLGPVRTRRMFGGQGVYFQGRIFALEVGGEIYLKTDAELRPRFAAAGSRAFAYSKGGKVHETSYWLMPEEGAEDPAAAALWARLALDAAARVGGLKTPKARRSAA